METRNLTTPLGRIAITLEARGNGAPVVFLHGLFLDASLWRAYESVLTDRPQIRIDLPAHGQSGNVGRDWRFDECVDLLIEILDQLAVPRCVVVGHSWGAMMAVRAAARWPERFAALGLFNMPFRRESGLGRIGFMIQKRLLALPRFYGAQAAKALYTPGFLRQHPEMRTAMQARISARPAGELARVIDAVALGTDDATPILQALRVPALAVIGAHDHVGAPPGIDTTIVPGGHISPHEAVAETAAAIQRVVALAG